MSFCSMLSRRSVIMTLSMRGYSTQTNKNVAFIGLGNMGHHMAANLVKKGFSVKGYDLSPEALKMAASGGVKSGKSILETIEGADAVVSILPNNKIVRDVYLGKDGIVNNVAKNAILIDSSTIDPSVSQEVYTQAKERGIAFIDAPVSGGVMGAENKTLAFMVGGIAADFDRSKPFLDAMGARLFHCGPSGYGQIVKLCNNMLMGICMLGTAECMNLGITLGIDPKILLEIINCSTGRSWSSEVYCPVGGLVPGAPSTKNYEGGFKNDLLVKDMLLATGLAATCNAPMPCGALSTQVYRIAQVQGHGSKDFSYIYKILNQK